MLEPGGGAVQSTVKTFAIILHRRAAVCMVQVPLLPVCPQIQSHRCHGMYTLYSRGQVPNPLPSEQTYACVCHGERNTWNTLKHKICHTAASRVMQYIQFFQVLRLVRIPDWCQQLAS